MTPVGTHAPLRGGALRDVDVIEDAFVLVRDGAFEAVGRMRDLPPLEGDVEEVDGHGLCAIPGLVDCHTHPAFAGDRANEFALRAGGATYEELLAAGGGILSTTRATRAAGAAELREIVARHRDAMLAHGTTTFEGKSGYGLDRDTELAQLEAVRAAGGVPTWLGAHAVPPEQPDADAYIDWAIEHVSAGGSPRSPSPPTCSSSGERSTSSRRAGTWSPAGRPGSSSASTVTSSARWERCRSRWSSARGRSTTSRPPARTAWQQLAASDVVAVMLPVAALYLARPMPPGRALVDAGAAIALATDFNPGSAFCESLPVVWTLACTQLGLAPEEALAASTVNAAHVLGLHDRGRIAVGLRADLVLIDAPDWRHLAYHLAGDVVHTVVREGRVAHLRA